MRAGGKPWRSVLGLVAVEFVVAVGLLAYATSEAHSRHDPVQQLDLFYLDEPAPFADELRLPRGQATLLVVCQGCRAPRIRFATRLTAERRIAAAYGLLTAEGRVGPGYAVVDRRGHVRYRTFDAGLARNGEDTTGSSGRLLLCSGSSSELCSSSSSAKAGVPPAAQTLPAPSSTAATPPASSAGTSTWSAGGTSTTEQTGTAACRGLCPGRSRLRMEPAPKEVRSWKVSSGCLSSPPAPPACT